MAVTAIRPFELRGTKFRMVREPQSTIVGIFRDGRVPRLLGYVFCDPSRPDCGFFPGYGGWNGGDSAWRWMRDAALRFYGECVTADRGQAVTGDGR